MTVIYAHTFNFHFLFFFSTIFFFAEMELRINSFGSILLATTLILSVGNLITTASAEGLRLPDQQSNIVVQQQQQPQGILPQQHVQQIYTTQQQQQPQQQFVQQPQPGGQDGQGRSSILSIFGLGGGDNDPYLARSNSNCLSGDLSECFKTQALNTFDEIFYREYYP